NLYFFKYFINLFIVSSNFSSRYNAALSVPPERLSNVWITLKCKESGNSLQSTQIPASYLALTPLENLLSISDANADFPCPPVPLMAKTDNFFSDSKANSSSLPTHSGTLFTESTSALEMLKISVLFSTVIDTSFTKRG